MNEGIHFKACKSRKLRTPRKFEIFPKINYRVYEIYEL